ncbi:hypothetical protein ACIQCG_07195 [Streptomyces noursei]|uniref:hypothetical protein n=1 Tax=Streptomyces noursei TaxID=1971 RepID=UPI003811255D
MNPRWRCRHDSFQERRLIGGSYRLCPNVADFSDLFTWDDLNEIIARHRLEPPRLRLFNNSTQVPQHAYTHPVVSKRHTVWHHIEPGNLHLTCSLKPTTGADLLS